MEKSLLLDRVSQQTDFRFLELVTIVHAIQEAANSIVSGESKFSNTAKNLKKIRDLLYPENASEVEDKAAKSKDLLEKEFSRGPLKVQALDYGSRNKKKRSR